MTSTTSKCKSALCAAVCSRKRRLRYSRAERLSAFLSAGALTGSIVASQSGSSRSRNARSSIADTPPSEKTAKASRACGNARSFTIAPAQPSLSIAARTISSMPFSQSSQNQESARPMRMPLTLIGTRCMKAKLSPRCGSSAAKLKAASAMLRARIPGVSKLKLSGTMPSVDQRSLVIFSPALPVTAAGRRTEAAVSEPKATSAEPSHSDTPAPLEEPPGERCTLVSQAL